MPIILSPRTLDETITALAARFPDRPTSAHKMRCNRGDGTSYTVVTITVHLRGGLAIAQQAHARDFEVAWAKLTDEPTELVESL